MALSRIESLRAKERRAEDYVPPAPSFSYPKPLDLTGAQSVLDPGDLVLHYFVGESSSYLVVISRPEEIPQEGKLPAGVRVFRIPVSHRVLSEKVNSFMGDIARPGSERGAGHDKKVPAGDSQANNARGSGNATSNRSQDSTGEGAALYSLLIEPIEPLLNQRHFKRLLISPNKDLNTLPFAALPTKDKGFVADLYPVTIISSLTGLAEMRSANQHAGTPFPVLVFGDPASPVGRLVHSANEAMAIANLYGMKPVLGKDVTDSAVKKLGGRARIIHFACHGRVDATEPMESGLALTPEGGADGFLHAYEVASDLHLNADLVVLSACQTGLGKNEGNEGLNGLTRAFQYAGAKSVLVSLWSVDDKSTSEFMQLFYKALKSGKSKDVALQMAEIGLRKKYPNPYYWAPFTLCGDWK
jgi:CHAT domain-containing protein